VAARGPDAVNAIFRAAHTIKGSAGMFGLDPVVAFTHVAESVLDKVRDGAVPVTDELVALLLACCDHIGALVDAVEAARSNTTRRSPPPARRWSPRCRPTWTTGAPAAAAARPPTMRMPQPARPGSGTSRCASAATCCATAWTRCPSSATSASWAASPASRRWPTPAGRRRFDPESCYLGFEIGFASSEADKAAIDGVFDFVRDDCEIRILPPRQPHRRIHRLIDEPAGAARRLGEMLVRCGSVTAHELEQALRRPCRRRRAARRPPIGAILVARAPPPVVEAALAKQRQAPEGSQAAAGKPLGPRRRRQAGPPDQPRGRADHRRRGRQPGGAPHAEPELQECTSTLSGLVEEVRDSALQLRMVKIGATFNRFQRVVHDVSRELGKDIRLEVNGEDAELDKTVVEKIGDPLTHLVRNAMDHGIEPADVRAARGKPAQGTVR
jgi:two-component system chemotaxis sensor kinase CheA